MSLTKVFNNFSNLIALGYADLNADDKPPNQRFRPGQMGLYSDDYGMRFVRYIKNVSAAKFNLGDVVRRVADVTFTHPTASTTTSVTKAATFTADAHIGKVLIYEVAAVAGTVPEGQSAIIDANTAGLLTLDPSYPFSVAPGIAANDAYRIWAPWHADITAGVVVAKDVMGAVVGVQGISVGNYGWVQFQGVMPLTKITAGAAIGNGIAVVTGSGVVATIAANAADTVVGYSLGNPGSTNSGVGAIFWTLGAAGAVAI